MGMGEVLSAGDGRFPSGLLSHKGDHISHLKDGGVLLYDSDVELNEEENRFLKVEFPSRP